MIIIVSNAYGIRGTNMSQLPILQFQKEIHEKLECSNAMIIEAEPGAGKTTEVPRMLKVWQSPCCPT